MTKKTPKTFRGSIKKKERYSLSRMIERSSPKKVEGFSYLTHIYKQPIEKEISMKKSREATLEGKFSRVLLLRSIKLAPK